MKFDWRKFTEADYNKYMEKWKKNEFDMDLIGMIYAGDICIELIEESWLNENCKLEYVLMYNFYVAHEDTGYGYKDEYGVNVDGNGMPYDYAEGDCMDIPYGLSYDEFKAKTEKLFTEYIEAYKGGYSLVEHANRQLQIW